MSEPSISRRDFLNLSTIASLLAIPGFLCGREAIKYFQSLGNQLERKTAPKTLSEQLQAGLAKLNYIAELGIKEKYLNTLGVNFADYAKNPYFQKQIEIVKVALQEKDELEKLIQENQPVPIFAEGLFFAEASEVMIDHGLAVAENLANRSEGVLFVNSVKFEHAGTLGESAFVVAVKQEMALNKCSFDSHKDLFLIQGQADFSNGAPLFSLIDMASIGENGSIKWLDTANQKAWEGSSLAKDAGIIKDFNPNPLLQV